MPTVPIDAESSWIALAVTGIATFPVVPLGQGPDVYLAKQSDLEPSLSAGFNDALVKSFSSFGIELSQKITLGDPKLIFIPMKDLSDHGIRIGLMVADMSLSIFNRKVFSAKARLLSWNRQAGRAVGVILKGGVWSPIEEEPSSFGPFLIMPPDYDFWDWFLGETIRGRLDPLGVALSKCMDWQRESEFSPHVAHKFAFNWIGLESLLSSDERNGTGVSKRYSMLVGAPGKYYAGLIYKDKEKREFMSKNANPWASLWKQSIKDMYSYRCEIIHEGGTDLSSSTIDAHKLDWFVALTEFLCKRVIALIAEAMIRGIKTESQFWDHFVLDFIASEDNGWVKTGVFHGRHVIDHDWRSGPIARF
ncbi:hypothetical protein [Pseudomonas sp. TSRC2-2]|uniref:hypothetical protein n=1 Tax=unclassified Pseudomonas TaxID=196821 RepID=UPI003CE75F43